MGGMPVILVFLMDGRDESHNQLLLVESLKVGNRRMVVGNSGIAEWSKVHISPAIEFRKSKVPQDADL
jgi:hypothetical protein